MKMTATVKFVLIGVLVPGIYEFMNFVTTFMKPFDVLLKR